MTRSVYKIVVLISFLILVFVQLRLIYNTYVLRDRDYNLSEKKLLNDEYGRSIPADKVYPGGGKIIDVILGNNMESLKEKFLTDRNEFNLFSQVVCDSIFRSLQENSKMDSVFQSIINRNSLDTTLHYLLTFQSIEIHFNDSIGNIFLYDSRKTYPLIDARLQKPYGIFIDGNLSTPSLENRVTHLEVSGSLVYNYRVSFNLYADRPYRFLKVAYQMLPTFSLAAICIIITVGINYYTYINWMKQKKDAEMKADFLNSIKHEFNTPITTILVASKSLDDDEIYDDKKRIRSLAHIVERQARRLQSHINQMIEISMIEKKLNLVETDLNYLIVVLVNDYHMKLQKQEILTFDPYFNEITVEIDPFIFTTMLNNMLDNSFKYNENVFKKTEVFIDDHNEHYALHVKDNGDGISEEVKGKIFDKFFRSNKNSNIPGLGLGLYYVKECLNIHGWTMEVKAVLGIGTEFIVFIPKTTHKI